MPAPVEWSFSTQDLGGFYTRGARPDLLRPAIRMNLDVESTLGTSLGPVEYAAAGADFQNGTNGCRPSDPPRGGAIELSCGNRQSNGLPGELIQCCGRPQHEGHDEQTGRNRQYGTHATAVHQYCAERFRWLHSGGQDSGTSRSYTDPAYQLRAIPSCQGEVRWRKRLGVEPSLPAKRRATGFEDREGHRAPFTSMTSD